MNRNRLLLAFAFVLALLAINAAVSLRATRRLIHNERATSETYQTIAALSATLAAVVDAETGERGYVITGREAFLDPYHRAHGAIVAHERELRTLLAADPARLRRLDELERRVRAALGHLGSVIAVRRERGPEAAAAASEEAKALVDHVRAYVERMRRAEQARLAVQKREAKAAATRAAVTFGVACAVALGLIAFAYALVRRDARRREAAADALRQVNETLEARVAERTASLEAANAGLEAANAEVDARRRALESEVAERRAAQERLRALTAELERSNRELQDFAYVASHDLQEPLRKIRMFADLLVDEQAGRLDAEALQSIARMQDAASRMSRLINDLLTFSRVASKARPAVPVALEPVLADVLDDLSVALREAGGEVDVGPLPTVYADPVQMRQLFQNLVGNALKFRRPNTPARVCVRAAADPEGWCRIEVEDNGIGFDEKYLDRIFTPFQRLHGRGEYAGTGIGLAVCRKIAERHGGTITARSEPGAGATFAVLLPCDAAVIAEVEHARPAAAEPVEPATARA